MLYLIKQEIKSYLLYTILLIPVRFYRILSRDSLDLLPPLIFGLMLVGLVMGSIVAICIFALNLTLFLKVTVSVAAGYSFGASFFNKHILPAVAQIIEKIPELLGHLFSHKEAILPLAIFVALTLQASLIKKNHPLEVK